MVILLAIYLASCSGGEGSGGGGGTLTSADSKLTIMIMQVPCCAGLLKFVEKAANDASRKGPIKYTIIGMQGEILREEWL